MKYLFLAVIIIFLGASVSFAQDDDCDKIRVGVYFNDLGENVIEHLNEKYGTKSKQEWIDDIDERVVKALQTNSPELDIFSRRQDENKDPHYIFRYLLNLNIIETNEIIPPIASTRVDPITGWTLTEWSEAVWEEETAFWNCGSLFINSPCYPNYRYILAIELTKDLELDGAIAKLSQGMWRLTNLIEESEAKRPVPARGPQMEIDYEKDYLSILEKEDREMEVKVKVKNCKGEYLYSNVESQPVYFQKDVNRCEIKHVLDCEDRGSYGNNEVVLTNKQYEAKLKYKVKEGIDASKEKVNLGTCGIGGSSEVWEEGKLIIRGLEIKVKPNRNQITCDESTEIKLTFSETDPDGNEYPIEGKDLEVKITGRVNGSLKAKNGYSTDANGEVILVYKAGSEDRNIHITASFQPEDYPEKVEGKGSITVKPVEYEARLIITKNLNRVLQTNREDVKKENVNHRQLNETINASATVYLKLIQTQEMPLFDQTWEYYQPIQVSISSFNCNYKETKHMSTPDSETHVDITRITTTNKIEGEEYISQFPPWMLVIDNESEKAVKLIPAGYAIEYEYNETEIVESSGKDTKESSSTTKQGKKTFELGPVGEKGPDPTAKKSDTWIQDYLTAQGVEIPAGVPIPNISNEETVKEIQPDILVSSGDGKTSFGGRGERLIDKKLEYGFERINLNYYWNMTRNTKK
jgi:hypothetical protein